MSTAQPQATLLPAEEAGPGDVYDVRISVVSAETLRALRFTRTSDAMNELQRCRAVLASSSADALCALYAAIGVPGLDPQDKKELLRLKRALARGKMSGHRMGKSLPLALTTELDRLEARHTDAQNALAQVELVFAADHDRTRALLAELARSPLVRNGILHSAPSLEALMDTPTWAQSTASDKRATRLAQFVYRAAAKTSPFSTFTCTGRPGAEITMEATSVPVPSATRLVRQLDGKIWALLLHNLEERPEIAAAWQLRPNPSLTFLPALDKFALLGPPPAEELRLLPDHPLIRRVAAMDPDPAPFLDWAKRLTGPRSAGSVEQDSGEVPMLVRAGVLHPVAPVSENTDQPLEDLLRWLDDHELTDTLPYAKILRRVSAALAPSPSPSPLDPVTLGNTHHALLEAVSDLVTGLGHDTRDLGADLQLVHESAVLESPVLTASIPSPEQLSTIAAARSWLSVLDLKWPGRLAVATYADAVMPPAGSMPLLDLYRRVHHELRRGDGELARHLRTWFSAVPVQPGPLTPTDQLDDTLRTLAQERQRCIQLATTAPEAGTTKLQLTEVIAHLTTRPEALRSTAPAAVYLQATGAADSRWVVNVMHGGHGRGRARTDHLMRCAGLSPAPIHLPETPGTLPAEYSGTHGSSLNARRPVLPAAIDYPYTPTVASDQQRIPVSRLHVRRTAGGLIELFDARCGTRIEPAHVGMLADYQLPPLARFVERVFGDAYLLHPSTPPFASDLALDRLTDITRIPRVQIDDVVIQRRRWIFPSAVLPRPRAGEHSTGYLHSLQEWFVAHELPPTAFVRAWGQELRGNKVKSRKPMLLDLHSWWTVTELLRHSTGADFIVLDEALPDPFGRDLGAAAVELLVEVPAYRINGASTDTGKGRA